MENIVSLNQESNTARATNHPPSPPSDTSSSDTVPCTPQLPPTHCPAPKQSFGITTHLVGGEPLDAQSSGTVIGEDVASSGKDSVPLRKRFANLFVSGRKFGKEPTVKESALAVVKASWINVMLIFIPVSRSRRVGFDLDTSLTLRLALRLAGVSTLVVSATRSSSSLPS